MKVKTYDQFLKEELGWKDALIGAAIGLSPFTPQKAKSQTPYTQQQNQKELNATQDEKYQFVVEIASGTMKFNDLSQQGTY